MDGLLRLAESVLKPVFHGAASSGVGDDDGSVLKKQPAYKVSLLLLLLFFALFLTLAFLLVCNSTWVEKFQYVGKRCDYQNGC